MAVAFVALGSNLGRREENLRLAVEKLRALPGTQVVRVSCWIETDPVGGPPQGKFLNGAAELETRLVPRALLAELQKIERELGRPEPHEQWGPRVIDLDLLSYGDLVLDEPGLTLPHPRMQERPFVLIPLAEIAPGWRHPHADR